MRDFVGASVYIARSATTGNTLRSPKLSPTTILPHVASAD